MDLLHWLIIIPTVTLIIYLLPSVIVTVLSDFVNDFMSGTLQIKKQCDFNFGCVYEVTLRRNIFSRSYSIYTWEKDSSVIVTKNGVVCFPQCYEGQTIPDGDEFKEIKNGSHFTEVEYSRYEEGLKATMGYFNLM